MTFDTASPDQRLLAAKCALQGLSVGDAFGQQFFSDAVTRECLTSRELPLPRWKYTDDTVMALAVCEILALYERIDQDALMRSFVRRYVHEPGRGYGSGANRLLRSVMEGSKWRTASRDLFNGEGSFGNGGAMRVAPVGAYFADDLDAVVEQARLSAEVTHSHADGIAGAIAVAIAAAWAWRWNSTGRAESPLGLIHTAALHTPSGPTRDGLLRALEFPLDEWEHTVAATLGNGSQITSADTVPFCLWCAAAHLDSFVDAMWATVRVGGDRDTNCAIIGSIVGTAVGAEGIPREWLRRRESISFETFD